MKIIKQIFRHEVLTADRSVYISIYPNSKRLVLVYGAPFNKKEYLEFNYCII